MRNLQRREALAAIGGAALFAGRASATAGLRRDSIAGPDQGEWHPLNLGSARYLSLPARLNDKPFNAVIDSGATRSVIRDDLALDLQLPFEGSTLATTFTGPVSGSLYRVDHLALDVASFHHVSVASYDMSGIERSVSSRIPFVIGQDVLRNVAVEMDFPGDRARFLTASTVGHPASHRRLEVQGADRAFPSLAITLEGRLHDYAIIDLGSALPMSISREWAADLGLLRDRRVSTTMTVGAEGQAVSQIFTLRNARIGPFTLAEIPVCVVENWQMERPINIGWPLFAAFDATLNLGADSLWLRPDPVALAKPFPKDRSGIGGVRYTDHIRVGHVAPDSPAWHAGLRAGDDIVALDGRAIDQAWPAPGERQGYRPAGTPVQLGLADGRHMDFQLADYF
ncbi:aspartyl protease family protein [Sphingomonas sp. MMS24-J13]|uniref:retropepsin-like aspartic protease n=1 Tax=Sphingomonas sp. MMS24-J13 TaxID=3238686 RepID=UPI00384D6D12